MIFFNHRFKVRKINLHVVNQEKHQKKQTVEENIQQKSYQNKRQVPI